MKYYGDEYSSGESQQISFCDISVFCGRGSGIGGDGGVSNGGLGDGCNCGVGGVDNGGVGGVDNGAV